MHRIFLLACLAFLVPVSIVQAETIEGHACYRFSDNESIAAARDIALSMAKREALEGYAVFVNATTNIENFTVKNDLITSISATVMRNLEVIDESEDLPRRQICKTIRADVDEVELKRNVTAKINALRRNDQNIDTGLPENDLGKVLEVRDDIDPADYVFRRVVVLYQCKRESRNYVTTKSTYTVDTEKFRLRLTVYNNSGIPQMTSVSEAECKLDGDIGTFKMNTFGDAEYRLDMPTTTTDFSHWR